MMYFCLCCGACHGQYQLDTLKTQFKGQVSEQAYNRLLDELKRMRKDLEKSAVCCKIGEGGRGGSSRREGEKGESESRRGREAAKESIAKQNKLSDRGRRRKRRGGKGGASTAFEIYLSNALMCWVRGLRGMWLFLGAASKRSRNRRSGRVAKSKSVGRWEGAFCSSPPLPPLFALSSSLPPPPFPLLGFDPRSPWGLPHSLLLSLRSAPGARPRTRG